MGPHVQPKCFRHPQHMRNNWELRKRGYLIRFGHTEALLLKKKRTSNGHFSRPAETDPYVFNRPTGIWGVSCIGWAVRSSRWPLFEWKEEQALWRSFQGWTKLNWKQHLKFNFTPLNSFLLCIINQTSKCHIYFLQWPAVPYPGDDPKTVGYCPGANTLIWFTLRTKFLPV